MSKVLVSFSLCVLLLCSVISVDGKKSGGRKPNSGGSSGSFGRRKQPDHHSSQNQGGTNQHFLDKERQNSNDRGHVGFEKFNNPSQGNPPGIGFGGVNNYKPSAPAAGGGLGSAFGGANYPPKVQSPHVQSAPYPTHNNPGGFGNIPAGGTNHNQPTGGFGTNPVGGTHYNQPGGFGSNPVGGTHYNQPGGFGSNPVGGTHYNQPGGFGSNPAGGTHYNQPGGFGTNPVGGTHNQPGFGQPGTHYNQPAQSGFGQPGGTHFNQPGYGGNTQGSHYPGGNAFGGAPQPNYNPGYPAGHSASFGGHQPNYNNYGGHGYNPAGSYGGYNPGGFGGGHPGSYGGGYNPGGFGGGYNPGGFGNGGYRSGGVGGYSQGGYQQKSGPGFGTGLLGGAAGALPLGLLLGYGLGSMTSSSSPLQHNNDAYNTWLKQRTEEKKQELNSTAAAAGTSVGSKAIDQTAIVNQILNETLMCPGGAAILDASFLNTLVPCNVTKVDFNTINVTEPVMDECKSLSLTLVQVNTASGENKTVTLTIKQNNVTGFNEFITLSYDIDFVSCITPLDNLDRKKCETRTFTADPYHILNETMTYVHTANFSIAQYNTTLNLNNSCGEAGACGPNSKPPRNITSTFINLSILPQYPANIMMSQCMLIKTNTCDPSSTTPCETPLLTSKQSIHTDSTLTKSDFANINFVLHQSPEIFQAFSQPPLPPPEQQQNVPKQADNPGTSSLTGTTTKSSAVNI
ncbi:uncharacterized protein LOC142324204 isoform X1 [Lycorma delicatula]|uniref:uncharacterized protein LOC142324204 isoform X1 n=1 Tax=Lycorma delicatula TaxID=130591 RepID=UPI003F516465